MNTKTEIVKTQIPQELDDPIIEPDLILEKAVQSGETVKFFLNEYKKLYRKHYEQEQTIDFLTAQ